MEGARDRQLVNRMIRASRFERTLYAEVAADATATRQAIQVVVIVALVTVFANLIRSLLDLPDLAWFGFDEGAAEDVSGTGLVTGLVFTPIAGILGWLAWSGAAWFIGTRIIAPGTHDVGFLEVARAIGFADAPGVLGVVAFIPLLGSFVQLAVVFWVLATSFFAIRESMHLSDRQAVATMVVAVIALSVLIAIMLVGAVLVGVFGAAFAGAVP